ncbi:MAG: RluA family pseudouridine synthase [Myxococcaceae bacterium]|nr:RluA family pseudouridine synthase [Myxococcaceae bacterium]MBH2006140.1 RluA family pseudouridine synthase [Myxococcaceae bacterium]
MNLLDGVQKHFRLASRSKAREYIQNGFVRVDGTVHNRPHFILLPGAKLELLSHRERSQAQSPYPILFEDDAILVTCKPAGMTSEKFVQQIRKHTSVILTHRLDSKVSGVMIFAKSSSIEAILETNWSRFEKIYHALVEGHPKQASGTVEGLLAENKALKSYITTDAALGKRAVTHYRTLEQSKYWTRCEIRIETGRKNQIRVHLASLGNPILGDTKYGADSRFHGRIALHAARFSCYHPRTQQWMTFEEKTPF